MKRIFTLFVFSILTAPLIGQVYLDEFDDGVETNATTPSGYSSVEENGEWTITGDGTSGPWDPFTLSPSDDEGNAVSIDISENNKVYVRAKASNLGTQLRLDVQDGDGFASTIGSVTKTLVSDYTVFEFDFTGVLSDGGFGGTPCDAATAPCPVDPTNITQLLFFINPGQGSFGGSVVLDFVSVGSAPTVGPVSDVWQDHFDNDNPLGFIMSSTTGLVNSISNSNWLISGDGTGEMWTPVNMLFFNPTTLDTIDVPVSDGQDKVFIRMKTNTPGTTIRVDLQDINDMATTAASVTKAITDEWVTYEYNYAGGYSDLGFGGTGCSSDQAPCPVDAARIANLILFVNPGSGAFVGDVEIDYISIGTPLEGDGGSNEVLAYGDHFSGDDSYVSTSGAFGLSVGASTFKITGTGVDAPFAAVAYSVHDMDTGAGGFVDVSANNKVFIRAKADVANTLLRIDLVDTAGYVTTIPSFTRLLESDYADIELDFSGNYLDGGYGGTPCDATTAPCAVDPTAISTVLFYPNPADGGFEGCLEIDYVSFGAPLGEDVRQYVDHFDNSNRDQWSDAGGFTVEEAGTEVVLTGDGSAGPYSAFNYALHNTENGDSEIVNIAFNNKLYVKAKSTVAGTPLRIDLVDEEGFATTEPSTSAIVGEEYSVLEFDYTGTYTDGGYGGTACDMGPCPVDGSVIKELLFYIDPDNGGYAGTMTIDWISTIEPLEEIDNMGPVGIDDYKDAMDDNSLDFVSDNDGLAVLAEEGQLKIIGDGTSGAFSPVLYELHEGAEKVLVNALNNNDKVYVRARSTVDGLPLRVDLQDGAGFLTSQAGLTQPLTTEFEIYEYNYAGQYTDGGFGGTACDAGPCPVDAERIDLVQFYIDPGIGMFDGELHIDWLTFGEPLSVSVVDHDNVQSARIFPNPALNVLYLDMQTNKTGQIRASIVDATGKVVKEQELGIQQKGKVNQEVDVAGLFPGLYIIHVTLDGQPAFYSKLIIE